MFYVTCTRPTEFNLVGPFYTLKEAEAWSSTARNVGTQDCTMGVFQPASEPVLCTIVDPGTGELRVAGDLPDSVAWALVDQAQLV